MLLCGVVHIHQAIHRKFLANSVSRVYSNSQLCSLFSLLTSDTIQIIRSTDYHRAIHKN